MGKPNFCEFRATQSYVLGGDRQMAGERQMAVIYSIGAIDSIESVSSIYRVYRNYNNKKCVDRQSFFTIVP